jgi:hypothetical protein
VNIIRGPQSVKKFKNPFTDVWVFILVLVTYFMDFHLSRDIDSICIIARFFLRFELSTAVTVKNVVFWNIAPCGSCKNQRFIGMYRLQHQGGKDQRATNDLSSK